MPAPAPIAPPVLQPTHVVGGGGGPGGIAPKDDDAPAPAKTPQPVVEREKSARKASIPALPASGAQVAAVRKCFAASKTGTLVLQIDASGAIRAATRGGDDLTADERTCVTSAIAGLSLGGGSYQLTIR
jgi:hypothetical protein